MVSVTLFVFFEDPHWVGLVQSVSDGLIEIGKETFGAEPSHAELRAFVLDRFQHVPLHAVSEPVRLPRASTRAGDHSHQARRSLEIYKEAMVRNAAERKEVRRVQREEEEARAFELRQAKRKKKRQGH